LALSGCHIHLPIEKAEAKAVSHEVVQAKAAAGPPADRAGSWVELRLTVPRETLAKIGRWGLYSRAHVINCRSGALTDVVWMKVDGVEADDFIQIKALLRSKARKQRFVLVGYASKLQPGNCARLNGGSYLLQKIASEPVPIKILG
jgi:hypothetical protein